MRLKLLVSLAAALALAAGPAAAQERAVLPTSKQPAPPVRALTVAPAAAPALTPDDTWVLDLTNGGRVTIQLRPDVAPAHVERIKTLTRQGFYNGLAFHRVIEGFMAQGGDPKGDGTGGSELADLPAEFNSLPHVRGAVAAARAGDPNSANSQFYIMFAPRFSLDGKYTVFGRVVGGMNHVDAVQRGEPPAAPTRIVRASLGADNLPPPTAAEIAAATPPPAPPAITSLPGLGSAAGGSETEPAAATTPQL